MVISVIKVHELVQFPISKHSNTTSNASTNWIPK